MKALLLVLGLGLAGIDPWGLALLLAALAAGARKSHVIAFTLATFTGTVALGVVFSLSGKLIAGQFDALVPDLDDPMWAVVEIIVAALIAYWVVLDLTQRSKAKATTQPKSPPRATVLEMVLSGLAFSSATVLDPTFFATAAIASQASALPPMIGLHAVWVLISQSPLFAFSLAFLFDAHQPLIDLAQPIWERVKRPVKRLFMIGLIIVAVGLTADAIVLFATGEYLISL